MRDLPHCVRHIPAPLAAGALAKDLKVTALQESLSLRDFVAPKGLATLRVPFPAPLAAGALAKDLKITALQESLSLRDFVAPKALRHPCPLAAGALAKHCYQGITQPGGRYFVSVQPLPKASFRRGRPETKLASLFAMLTP